MGRMLSHKDNQFKSGFDTASCTKDGAVPYVAAGVERGSASLVAALAKRGPFWNHHVAKGNKGRTEQYEGQML